MIERNGNRNLRDGQDPLVHREAGHLFEKHLFRGECVDVLSSSLKEVRVSGKPLLRKQQREHGEIAFE